MYLFNAYLFIFTLVILPLFFSSPEQKTYCVCQNSKNKENGDVDCYVINKSGCRLLTAEQLSAVVCITPGTLVPSSPVMSHLKIGGWNITNCPVFFSDIHIAGSEIS